ncbi:NAD(P)-binding protein [Sistotremastrum niveocremeum HHB9708]|uniref:NAD(P)-binding protein n=1 Tax=Sistotremastrum niveocremeum HHB9708 TaxID=1314777 RepID=A0A164N9V1_9AGAM|nr:NAD(P)-binding protein [Sistotremastrum niveocremeum HHB9708]
MGSLFSRRYAPLADLPDLHGKVIIVTGASAGIGKYTVLHLARKGAKVYLAARNESKTIGVIKELEIEGLGPGNGSLHYVNLNLSDPRSAKKSGQEFIQRESRLDVLINNAGFVEEEYAKTKDGLGETIVANFLSPFVYTNALLPLLKSSAQEPDSDVRIVNVASSMHTFPPSKETVFDSSEALNNPFSNSRVGKMQRYGYSKLANILHINELQRRLDEENVPITCISLHPGTIATPGVQKWFKNVFPFGGFSKVLAQWLCMTQEDGAITSAFAAGSTEVKNNRQMYKAAYLVPFGKFGTKSKDARDPQKALDLWNTAERMIEELKL